MNTRFRPVDLMLALFTAWLAGYGVAHSSVESGAIERSFRNDAILREERRGVGRPLPGLADPLETGKIGAAFEHAEIDALESGDSMLPGPEESYDDDSEGFISPSGTYVEISPRDALRAEIPDVARLYFADFFDTPEVDESDPPPPPMNYTLLDEMIETRERMTARVGKPAAPEAEEREEPRIGRFLEEKEKPVLRISKRLEKTIERRDGRRPARHGRDDEDDDEEYEDEPATRAAAIPRVARSDAFRWPVVAKRISSRFGWRIHPIRRRRKFHNGVDLAANYGRPIVACGEGVVEYSGWKNYYGKTVIIRHPNGLKSLYAHCSKINVARGQKVSGGARIAAIGSTGLSTGPHLHFGIIKNGQFVNPLPYLK